jgi:hypothetical protein
MRVGMPNFRGDELLVKPNAEDGCADVDYAGKLIENRIRIGVYKVSSVVVVPIRYFKTEN